MKKKRRFPSYLRSLGFILIIFSVIALPSASENSRFIVLMAALFGVVMVVVGISLGIYWRERKK
ncbi:MAG: hypothetical protein E4H23_01310 [Chrysiogenales bacterium]|nr:MAG: hypothetical protein E4H23_01310 [Chrysiogenales bacterium]